MKTKSLELDVDVMGTQPSNLTKEEEKMISDYIRLYKAKMIQKKSQERTSL